MKYVSKLASNYQRCATNALYAMKNGWICALAFWVTTLAFNLVSGFMGPLRLGLAGGLVIGMLHLALITYCYRWILLTRDSRWTRLPFKNKVQALSEFDGELFTVIINTAFPIFLAEFALSTLTNGISAASTLPGYLKLAVVFLFNPLPEIIMVSRSRGTQSLMEALQFIKQNVVEWFFPIILLFAPALILFHVLQWFQFVVLSLVQSEVLLPVELASDTALKFLSYFLGDALGVEAPLPLSLIGTLIGFWFAIFRIELFEKL